MTLYIDLQSRKIVTSATQSDTPVGGLTLKRGDLITIDVVFLSGGAVASLAESSVVTITLKKKLGYKFDPLAKGTSAAGAAEATSYPVTLDLNTDEADDAFSQEQDSVPAIMDVSWTDSGKTTTPKISVDLQNSINRDGEIPSAAVLLGTSAIVATPANDTDFSMFAGSVAPTTGYYEAITTTKLWRFKGGWTKWRHAVLQLSD